jgi:hypothetical protein
MSAVIVALLFLIFSSPIVYSITDKFGQYVGYPYLDARGCPTHVGRFVHAVVLLVVVVIILYLSEHLFFSTVAGKK